MEKKIIRIILLKKKNKINNYFFLNIKKIDLDKFYTSNLNKKYLNNFLYSSISLKNISHELNYLKKDFKIKHFDTTYEKPLSCYYFEEFFERLYRTLGKKYDEDFILNLNFKKFSNNFELIFRFKDLKDKLKKFFKKININFLFKYSIFFFLFKYFKYKSNFFFYKNIFICYLLKNLMIKKLPLLKKNPILNIKIFFKYSWIKYLFIKKNIYIYTPIKRNIASYSLGMYDKFLNKNIVTTQIGYIQYTFYKFCKFINKNIFLIFTNIINKTIIIINTLLKLIEKLNKYIIKTNFYNIEKIFFMKKWNIYSIKGPKKPRKKKYALKKKKKYFY